MPSIRKLSHIRFFDLARETWDLEAKEQLSCAEHVELGDDIYKRNRILASGKSISKFPAVGRRRALFNLFYIQSMKTDALYSQPSPRDLSECIAYHTLTDTSETMLKTVLSKTHV